MNVSPTGAQAGPCHPGVWAKGQRLISHSACLIVCASIGAASLSAQSLGDIARQEAERRKSVVPGRVYTNDSLRPAPLPVSPPATVPAPASVAPLPSPAAGASLAAEPVKKDEVYWRTLIQTENDALERAKVLLEALQSRINGLQTDFVNRDDPAARATIAAERLRALGELDRTRIEALQRTKALAAIREEARRAGVPAAWYR
jgi:hypothetical protein